MQFAAHQVFEELSIPLSQIIGQLSSLRRNIWGACLLQIVALCAQYTVTVCNSTGRKIWGACLLQIVRPHVANDFVRPISRQNNLYFCPARKVRKIESLLEIVAQCAPTCGQQWTSFLGSSAQSVLKTITGAKCDLYWLGI